MTEYHGLLRPFAAVLMSSEIKEKAMPVLEAMKGHGYSFCGFDKPVTKRIVKKAGAVLVFVSEAFDKDETLKELLVAAKSENKAIIPVQLEGCEMGEFLRDSIIAYNIIKGRNFKTPEQLAERLLSAEALSAPKLSASQKKTLGAAGAFIAAAIVLALVFGFGGKTGETSDLGKPQESHVMQLPEIDPTLVCGLSIVGSDCSYTFRDIDNPSLYHVVVNGEEELVASNDVDYGSWESGYMWHHENDEVFWTNAETDERIIRSEWDLSSLSQMDRLTYLSLVEVKADSIPDLSKLDRHLEVSIRSCEIGDLSGFAGSSVYSMIINNCSAMNLSGLSGCEKLEYLEIECTDTMNLSGVAPSALKRLIITGETGEETPELSVLASCRELSDIELHNLGLKNLDFLANTPNLRSLRIENLEKLKDFSALGSLPELMTFDMQNSGPNNPDLSDLKNAKRLYEVYLSTDSDYSLSDTSFLEGHENLKTISVWYRLPNVDFLRNLGCKKLENLGLNYSGDFSPISELESINSLGLFMVNDFGGRVQPLLADKSVRSLDMYGCTGIDVSMLSTLNVLRVRGFQSEDLNFLTPSILRLEVEENSALSSLSGIENCPNLRILSINRCPRLTDWSALDGKVLTDLWLNNLIVLPDFGSFTFTGSLWLERIAGVENLDFLNAIDIDPNKELRLSEIRIVNMPDLKDVSALARLKTRTLVLNSQFSEQGHAFVYARAAMDFFEEPDNEYMAETVGIVISSIEDLSTLPESLLSRAETFCIAGDIVFNDEYQWWNDDWENATDDYCPIVLCNNMDTSKTEVGEGVIRNLASLSALKGIKTLRLINQPIDSLEGIEAFTNLEVLEIARCPVSDLSPAFALQNLRQINASSTQINSIQGVQNLTKLGILNISDTNVSDLSPLSGFDFGFALSEFGSTYLNVNSLHDCYDYSPIASVKGLTELCIGNSLTAEQMNVILHGIGDSLHSLDAFCCLNDESIAIICERFPDFRHLWIPWNEEITDLSPVLSLEKLETLNISHTMAAADASLANAAFGFDYSVE